MGYTPIPTQSAGGEVDAAEANAWLKDNFAAGVPDIMTAAGDIPVATAADVADVLGIGTNGQVLTVDTSLPKKIKWAGSPLGTFTARYTRSTAQGFNTAEETIIQFNTVDYDASGLVTLSPWKCTAPAGGGGKWFVTGGIRFNASAQWAANEYAMINFYVNGSLYERATALYMQAAGTYQVGISFWGILNVSAGQYFDVRLLQNSGGGITTDGDAAATHIAIARLFA